MMAAQDQYIKQWNEASTPYIEKHPKNVLYNKVLLPYIYDLIDNYDSGFAIDAGCGTGHLAARLYENGLSVEAFDPIRNFIEIAEDQHIGPRYSVGGFDLNYFDKADLVICINVLNNIPSLTSAYDFFDDHCKSDGGNLILCIEHPIRTRAKSSEISYNTEFKFVSHFLGEDNPISGWHRDIASFINPLAARRFCLRKIIEVSAGRDDLEVSEYFGEGPYFMIMEFRRT